MSRYPNSEPIQAPMSDYFTDREHGPVARTRESIDDRLWRGLYSLIETRLDDGSFGLRFPLACPDSAANAYGSNRSSFASMLEAEVPWINWPLQADAVPDTPVVLDLLEFCAAGVGRPIAGSYHGFFQHHRLSWDREAGLTQLVADVNRLFARNGVAFELTDLGKARRLLPPHLGQALTHANFATGDSQADGLLEAARSRFLAPKVEDRRDGLEKLWDAFERIKTLEPGAGKKASADTLLDRAAAPGTKLRKALGNEAVELTQIGNTHRIRHSETSQEPLETTAQVDYLFGRLFAFIHLVLTASGRVA
jgi:hypothetical protein